MTHDYFLQIFLIFSLIFSLTCGRALFYDELESDDKINSYSDESEEREKSQLKSTSVLSEAKQFQQRSILNASRSSQSRQQFIDILRKAYNQGWKPNLKHYVPATRFGRHR